MTIEARELYCYVTGTEPFATEIQDCKYGLKALNEVQNVVSRAVRRYARDYCSHGFNPFSKNDIDTVIEKLLWRRD